MDKKSKIALYTIGLFILAMIIAEVTKPKAISWRDSYSAADKIPLGCYVIFNELEDFSNQKILTSTQSLYSYLKKVPDSTKSTLLLINSWANFDNEESKSLEEFVKKGNTVFISAKYINGLIIDSLNIKTKQYYGNLFKVPSNNTFSNSKLKKNNRVFKDVIENSFFSSIDTLKTTVLGNVSFEDEDNITETHPNFIKVAYANNDRAFFIHTNPYAFSNYHMLNGNEDYAATVLSYLPKHQLIWDNYIKAGRKIVTSPLRFIMSSSALKWSFYLILLILILFVLFRGKRTQRVIPVIEPLKNSTVEFTQTIGDLYYQNRNYKSIIDKKITYFLEFIRNRFYLNTSQLNTHFIERLAIKSSNTKETTKTTIDLIVHLKNKQVVTENDLIQLNKQIEIFTKNTK